MTMSGRQPALRRAIESAGLVDDFEGQAADLLMKAARNVESMRYFVSVGRVAEAALKFGSEAARARHILDQAEQAPDQLGVGSILRYSEAFAAWAEGAWDPPSSVQRGAPVEVAREIAVLAFIADVNVDLEARQKADSVSSLPR
jgi:hypothetical protein